MYFEICFWLLVLILIVSIFINMFTLKDLDVILVLFVSAIIMIIVGFIINYGEVYEKDYSYKTELYNVNDFIGKEYNISGTSFIFVQANVSESDTYNITYAYKDENGVIRPKQIKTNFDKIGYIEDGNSYYEEVHHGKFIIHSDLACKLFGYNDKTQNMEDHIIDNIFHVPEGSIVKDKKIDLK